LPALRPLRSGLAPLAFIVPLALVLSGCSMAGIKPAPGPATAAIAALAPASPSVAGAVPRASSIPPAPASALGYAATGPGNLDGLIAHYANAYSIPETLLRRVIVRESNYNPAARNGPYWGLMQIRHDTAAGMGYRGSAAGLLDAETNLRYAARYLAGAYMVAQGNHDRAVRHYASGYYYDAKAMGLLEKSGLR
jgi:soluble lytic murein transglycosylase-like protein